MEQIFVNWALAAFSGLMGFLLNQLWAAVKDLQTGDQTLATKISDIEVLVAGQYCVEMRDATWATLYQIMAEVEASTRPMPTGYADIESELPALAWPQ